MNVRQNRWWIWEEGSSVSAGVGKSILGCGNGLRPFEGGGRERKIRRKEPMSSFCSALPLHPPKFNLLCKKHPYHGSPTTNENIPFEIPKSPEDQFPDLNPPRTTLRDETKTISH